MFTRRELLTGGTTLLLLLPIVGCSDSGGSTSPTPPTPPTCSDGNQFTSSLDAQHTHTLCVLTADLTNPPAAGVTYTTSSDGGHSHKVALTQAQLAMINSGQTVMVTSSSDNDPIVNQLHSHTFAISKAGAGSGPDAGTGSGPDAGTGSGSDAGTGSSGW